MADEMDIEAAADSIAQDLNRSLDASGDGSDAPGSSEASPPPLADGGESRAAAPSSLTQAGPSGTPASRRPDSWRKEVLEKWDSLPPEVQAEVLRREDDYNRGIGQSKWLPELLGPYEPVLRQQGVEARQLLGNLLNAHMRLTLGTPEQKKQIAEYLFKAYGLQMPAPPAAPAGDTKPANEEPYMDPALQVVNKRVEAMQGALQGLLKQQFQSAFERTLAEVNKFAADPENAFFGEVSGEVQRLMQANPHLDLATAYRTAVFSNPAVAEKEVQRLLKKEAAKRQTPPEPAAQHVKTPRPIPRLAKPAETTGNTLEDTMRATLSEIKGRAA